MNSIKLTKEEKLQKSKESMQRFRDAVKQVTKQKKNKLPDTEKNIKERARTKAWREANLDKLKDINKVAKQKQRNKAKSRIAEALAQFEATQKKVEEIEQEIE